MKQERRLFQLSNKERSVAFAVFLVFCALVLFITGFLTVKAQQDSQALLKDSIQSLLLSAASSAKEIIDPVLFETYDTIEDAQTPAYRDQLERLRLLADHAGAEYIYAIKELNGKYVLAIDTDVNGAPMAPYEPGEVHFAAYNGRDTAGISNLVDEFGSFSTGAVPLRLNGEIIGVVAVDIKDALLIESTETARRNLVLVLSIVGATLLLMSLFLFLLLGRVKRMQDRLQHMANHDKLTNLPNRQFLLDHLSDVSNKGKSKPYALFFIDLDNFKKVNDNAGHDAGDALLRNIGHYLEAAQVDQKVFRPGPGMLNIAARIGGDEFVLVVPGIESEQDAAAFAASLLSGFRQDEIDRYIDKYKVGLSIGIALYPHHTTNFNVLIKYADIAMYHAKFEGKNSYRVYNDEMKPPEEK